MIYKLIRSGELRSVTIGRTRRVPMTELERLIDVGGGGGATRPNALRQPARSSGALLDRSDPAPSPGARRARAVEQLVLVPGR
jgi:hypothetical protein